MTTLLDYHPRNAAVLKPLPHAAETILRKAPVSPASTTNQVSPYPPLVVLDSGKGARTVVRALRDLGWTAPLTLIGDPACAPYGEKSAAVIASRIQRAIELAAEEGYSLAVIGCHTASVARRLLPVTGPVNPLEIAVIDMLDSSCRLVRHRTWSQARVAVLCSHFTAESGFFASEVARFRPDLEVLEIEASGLVAELEKNSAPDRHSILRALGEASSRIARFQPTHLLLGCTHFPLISRHLHQLFPTVELLDPAPAVAASLLRFTGTFHLPEPGLVNFPQLRNRLRREGFCASEAVLPAEPEKGIPG